MLTEHPVACAVGLTVDAPRSNMSICRALERARGGGGAAHKEACELYCYMPLASPLTLLYVYRLHPSSLLYVLSTIGQLWEALGNHIRYM